MPAASRFATIGASLSFGGEFGEERRPGGGALARHVDEVLPGDRHAIERPGRASLAAPLAACLGFLQRPLAGNDNEGRIAAIALDAIEEEFRDFDRVEVALGDEPPDFGGGTGLQVFDHAATSLRPSDPHRWPRWKGVS